ncbi:short-chain dehydrogenase/reductase [Leifsonia sp. LS1]|uniref:SDR family oxidoreductase n=1 Tax=Leifsonia sp. LS1 TaxID=2828483 RepID=UPI001CFE4408|nr:SDR family oxidoreductase [Leifsonia sp. LS1]GIT80848.1 short-chain dehydrogenase/reductase [Leifsonia sp. LS1]
MRDVYDGTTVLVTGANRGVGAAFADALVELGAKKVYAAARDPETVRSRGVTPVRLDVTDRDQAAALAERLSDVTMVINNAGIHRRASLFDEGVVDVVDSVLRTNLVGTLTVSAAFAPRLVENGGGIIANMLSAGSWLAGPGNLAYAVSKAAALSLTNNMRAELGPRGVQVTAIHAGFIDTDMMAAFPGRKLSPREVAAHALSAIASGAQEVLIDDMSRAAKAASAEPVPPFAAA